jgi:hypothetical protein
VVRLREDHVLAGDPGLVDLVGGGVLRQRRGLCGWTGVPEALQIALAPGGGAQRLVALPEAQEDRVPLALEHGEPGIEAGVGWNGLASGSTPP